jgi:hypothetical protein
VTVHAAYQVGNERIWLNGQFEEQRSRCEVLGVGLVQERKGPLASLSPAPDQG